MSTGEQARPSRARGQQKTGTVVGKPGAKTVTILVERMVSHPVYERFVRRSKKFLAHDEADACMLGDKVEIVECRPLSARKRWRVQRVVERAAEGSVAPRPETEA